MPNERKYAIVAHTAEQMRSAKAIYFTDFKGLTAPQATELRAKFREGQVNYLVVKKTLSRLAAQEAGIGNIDEFLVGQVGMALAEGEPTGPARILREFSKGHNDIPAVTGIYFDGAKLPASRIDELAKLSSKEVLLAQLLSALQSPMTRLAQTLAATMTKLGQILTGLKDQKTL